MYTLVVLRKPLNNEINDCSTCCIDRLAELALCENQVKNVANVRVVSVVYYLFCVHTKAYKREIDSRGSRWRVWVGK